MISIPLLGIIPKNRTRFVYTTSSSTSCPKIVYTCAYFTTHVRCWSATASREAAKRRAVRRLCTPTNSRDNSRLRTRCGFCRKSRRSSTACPVSARNTGPVCPRSIRRPRKTSRSSRCRRRPSREPTRLARPRRPPTRTSRKSYLQTVRRRNYYVVIRPTRSNTLPEIAEVDEKTTPPRLTRTGTYDARRT